MSQAALHRLPETPSPLLNSWLKSHFTVSSNVVQYVVGYIVSVFFDVASKMYHATRRASSNVDAKTAWMASCGLLGVAVAVAAWLAFSIVMATTFIFHAILQYAATLTGVVGVGLGVAGALYFGRDLDPTGHQQPRSMEHKD